MKLIEFKDYNSVDDMQTLNKKKLAMTITICVILILLIVFFLIYVYNVDFRNWSDMHILMKTVSEGNVSSIDVDSTENVSIYAYDKYVAVASVNRLDIYNSSAKKMVSMDIDINVPIFESNGKYLVVGDKGKQMVSLISGTKILWTSNIEGAVSRVSVNESGYVSVVCTGSTYKSIITVYNPLGEELFKTHIPNNTVIDSTISSDNRYLSFAEIDTSQTMIQSTVKTISIKEATDYPANSLVYTYTMPNNSLIINIKYQGSKNLICMCDDGINLLSEGKTEQLINLTDESKKYAFAGINLTNAIFTLEESADGISNQSTNMVFLNTGTKKYSSYMINGIAKGTASSADNIAINLGTEVYFVSPRGWLIKKYIAEQEIRNVIVSDRIAVIIFRDKMEILIL